MTECKICNIAILSKYCKKSGFAFMNNRFYSKSKSCSSKVEPIYNPFEDLCSVGLCGDSGHYDKHYEKVNNGY